MMKRVMIVDDEFIMRIGIKSMISWEANGYQLVGEATNGQDAIDKIALLQPHIILTDLMMEPVNGLQLIEYCQKHHPQIRLAVLSNYDDFENVKTAMKLGAKDYLLKLTTQPEQLLSILNEISNEIDAQATNEHNAQALINRSASVIRQRILRMMMDPACAMRFEDIHRDLQMIDATCDPERPYALLYLSVTNFFLLEESGEGLADSMFCITLENAIDEIVRTYFQAQVFHHEKGVYLVLINLAENDDDITFRKKVNLCFDQINTCVERYFGMCIVGCISEPVCGAKAFAAVAEQCASIVRDLFTMRVNRLLSTASERKLLRSAIQLPDSINIAEWQMALECFDFGAAKTFLTHMLSFFYDQPIAPRTVREKLYELYRVWKIDGKAKCVLLEELTDSCGLTLYQAIFQYDLLSMIDRSFQDVLDAYQEQCRALGSRPLNRDIAQVLAYVKSDLKRNISAPAAAQMIHMSESYFSRFFKREMGLRFVDYVNRLRIEKSKELLLRTDRRINDIAGEVGIENPNYFSILFKKQTGISPMEYRETASAGNPSTRH